MKQSLFKKTAVLFGAASIAVAGLLVPAAAQANTGNIDATKNGKATLTIHKFKADDANQNQRQTNENGVKLDASTLGTPLEGVEFTLTRVAQKNSTEIDLSTPAGWNLIKDLKGKSAAEQVAAVKGPEYILGDKVTNLTAANGEAVYSNQQFGLYLVEETKPGNNNVTAPAEPFLVTLPLANGSGWNYDVHVYPKNTVGEDISKTVTATNEEAVWTVNSPVPALATGQTGYTRAVVSDDLDSRLTYKQGTATVGFIRAGESNVTAFDPADFNAAFTGQKLTVTLTDSGLRKLAAGTLQVKFTTTVTDGGSIQNTIVSNINDSTFDVKPGTPKTPEVYYGYLKLNKQTAAAPKLPLQNAEFGIYASEDEARAGNNPVARIKTGADGSATQQLLLGNKDAVKTVGGTSKVFYVKELVAPAGYVLDETVRQVTVTTAHTKAAPSVLTVDNEKALVPGLPLTGGQGATLLAVAGGALVIAGIAVAVVRRRKQAAAH
ncbi:SpaH/EbpB family LPXTG-anchored major pilin [Leucobacter sp. OH1287]|uniref:SpaH/EbpB family LPXTG-anchored major pilin n=1 Tax=Leucobacter sp. OH1287 TaxID=2491049 RepID=UPI000F5DC242|nr:SpaH/EbpB family LPXTG-anchored major pilin [Leucobacter sp. OH1287]RRD59384.1 isopeptide-forming domain-containing fimbrial protein [Leucobacter sp. OH1287]